MESICDYSNYDYKKKFWEQNNRQYEHYVELYYVQHLLKSISTSKGILLDAGCGFGRLFSSYCELYNEFYLVDYAQSLIEEAKKNIDLNKFKVLFLNQSLYELSVRTPVSTILSIRTLHHLNDLTSLFNRFNKALLVGGHLLIDIPNYYHLKNRIKMGIFIGKKQDLTKKSNCYYNYDPEFVIKKLQLHGFNVKRKKQIGLFRINMVKKIVPVSILIQCEKLINFFMSTFNVSPSVYVLCEKYVDKFVEN